MSDDATRGHTETWTFSAEAVEPVPVGRFRRWWLRLRRKPLPTRAPAGTVPLMVTTAEQDGRRLTIYIPAARMTREPPP